MRLRPSRIQQACLRGKCANYAATLNVKKRDFTQNAKKEQYKKNFKNCFYDTKYFFQSIKSMLKKIKKKKISKALQ